MKLGGTGVSLEADLSGASSLKGREFKTETGDFHLSGASSAEVAVSTTLEADLSGVSSLSYLGDPETDADVSDASRLNRLSNTEVAE